MNNLRQYFNKNTKNLIHKWHHYFDIYDCHFSRFRNTCACIVEFGISHGGSLQMWKDYFGNNCKIIGIDINPECQKLEEDQIQIFIGDQNNRDFLQSLIKQIPHIDILIDDGGHTMTQQIATFEELFPHIDRNGVYLCEDLHTSYIRKFGGGLKKEDTFIEYSKDFIDRINAWHNSLPVDEFTKSAYSLHYYDSVLVIEKRHLSKPTHSQKGHKTI